MLQDIYPNRFQNSFGMLRKEHGKGEPVMIFRDREILYRIAENGSAEFPRAEEFSEGTERELIPLFQIDEQEFFLKRAERREETEKLERVGYAFHGIRSLRKMQPRSLAFAGATGFHLYMWYRDNAFCGRCGSPMGQSGKERAMHCPRCGNTVYPKISPAVIVGVTDGDRILMSRYAGREYKGNALLAGFCEIGETAEETVRREVMEEVGVRVKNIRYFASQPWGFESDLLLGYFCEVTGNRNIILDEDELASAAWVERKDIPEENDTPSLTATMIQHFRKYGKDGNEKESGKYE